MTRLCNNEELGISYVDAKKQLKSLARIRDEWLPSSAAFNVALNLMVAADEIQRASDSVKNGDIEPLREAMAEAFTKYREKNEIYAGDGYPYLYGFQDGVFWAADMLLTVSIIEEGDDED